MGYKIDYYKFIQFQSDMEDLLGRMMEDLAALKDLETFMLYSQGVQCKSMACVNKYIQDKHLGIVVPAIETAASNFLIVENAYFMEMYDIEDKSGSIIEEEHLADLITTLTTLNTNITAFLKEMNDKAKAVNHIIALETKSEEDFQDTMDALISMVSTLKTSFEEYEINKLVEANGSEWVVNGSTTAVDDVRYDDTEITEYQPEVNIEMEVPEFALRSATFFNEFGYTEERLDNILETKEVELALYAKAMEGQRLEQYFNNLIYAGVSMFLPFGNKFKGMKLILSEGLSLFSMAYSADRCYKGYQMLEQVELKDTETEATGLFNLENSKYGDAIIFMGEASNLYTSVAASNVVTCKIYGTPTTFASTLGDCGEEIVTSKAEDIVYNITDGNDIAATIIGGYIGNRVRRGVSLELEGIEDVIPSGKINNKTDFNNSSDFDTINSMQGYVVEDSDIDVVWREDVGTDNGVNAKPLSEMTDLELQQLGYKRYSDGSIRDKYGHFAGNSGVVPGTPGVDAVETYLADSGYDIKGREISVRNKDGKLRRYDIVVVSPEGTVVGVEVKSGGATRTARQKSIDDELIGSGGLKTVGERAIQSEVSVITDVKVIHVDNNGKIFYE